MTKTQKQHCWRKRAGEDRSLGWEDNTSVQLLNRAGAFAQGTSWCCRRLSTYWHLFVRQSL